MNDPAQLERLLQAINRAKAENADVVRDLDLREVSGEITERFGLWSVPVASGTSVGNAHRLLDGLRAFGQAIERNFDAPVSVYYTPSFIPPTGAKA